MKKLVFNLLLIFGSLFAKAQTMQTHGNNSAIIKGANNKVKYIIAEKSKFNIPENLVNYVAGLLMMNRIDQHDQVNQALSVWIGKYNQLQTKVKALADGSKKTEALDQLQLGNFPEVENLLNIKTNYTSFNHFFSNAIQTNGDQSPVIIGDYNNVTYTVTQIIQYNLPEGVTLTLLNQLKAKDNDLRQKKDNIQALQTNVTEKEEALRSWIHRYRQIADQLKNSPDAAGKRAALLFENGDLDGALRELDKASGSEIGMAKNRLLKARIMTLQFDYKDLDAQLDKIKTYYETSVPLIPTYENNMDYCRFLVDFKGDGSTAIPILQKTLNLAQNLSERVEVLNYLAICFLNVDKINAVNYIQQALTLLDEQEPLTEEKLVERKAALQFNLGAGFAINNLDQANIKASVDLTNKAIETLRRVRKDTLESQKQIAIMQSSLGKGLALEGDFNNSMITYKTAQRFYENEIKKQPQIWLGLSMLYYNIGDTYMNLGQRDSALLYLQNSRLLLEPNVNVHNKMLFFQLSLIYTGLVNYYQPVSIDSVKIYLLNLDRILEPLYLSNKEAFGLSRAAIYADLGTIYNIQGNFTESLSKLEASYDLFMHNLATIQANTQKFYICINQLTNTYAATRQFEKGISFNHELIRKIKQASNLNPMVFNTIVSQAYSQLATIYLVSNMPDSALVNTRQAIAPIEIMVKQYPILYADNYILYTAQLIYIYSAKSNMDAVDSVFKHYINTWNDIYALNDLASKNVRSKIAESTSNFAFTFYQTELAHGLDLQILYSLSNRFLDMADRQFQADPLEDNKKLSILQRANFYYRRAYFENDQAIHLPADNNTAKSHALAKCNYYQKCTELLARCPPNNQLTISLWGMLGKLPTTDCH